MEPNDTRRAAGTIAITWAVGGVAALIPVLVAPEQVDSAGLVIALCFVALLIAGVVVQLGRRIWLGTWALAASEIGAVAGIVTLVAAGGELAGTYAQLMALVAIKAALHLQLRAAAAVIAAAIVSLGTLTFLGQLPVADAWVAALVAVAVAVPAHRYARLVRTSEGRFEAQDRWWRASIGGFAHDARSPLSTIMGIADLLIAKADDPRLNVAELSSAIKSSSQRVLALADDLLDLQRVDDGQLVLQQRTIDAEELLHRVAAATREHVDVISEPGLVIRGDLARLEQVLDNLTSNALKYGEEPVQLFAHRDGADILLGVRDHGEGVPAVTRPKLFSRFGRGDHDDATGLGLWICRQLVEAHGGTLEYVDADPGAQFIARLPDRIPEEESILLGHIESLG